MIDEKKIEEAIHEVYNSNAIFRRYETAEIAFKAGINWFLDNLWHYASEEPKLDHFVIVESFDGKDNTYDVIWMQNNVSGWNVLNENFHITRWLYIDDLLKGDNNG